MRAGISRRRFLRGGAVAAFAAGVPMLNLGGFEAFAAAPRKYSARALIVVERSLVIDMLGVLKIDFTPEAYASPISDEVAAQFLTSGINVFHNSIGTGGPSAVEDSLTFLAA